MISQHDNRPIAKGSHIPEHVERLRSPIDQVTDEPDAISRGVEGEGIHQPAQFVKTALNVADCVCSHARYGKPKG